MAQALAETINYATRARAFMPPGTVPPFVMRFDAGNVPVGNLVFTSESRTVGELQDFALNRVRPLFATLPGVSATPPFGASQRTIVVRVDPEHLRSYNISIDELVDAISNANTISPSGQCVDRHPAADGPAQFCCPQHQGIRGRADPHGGIPGDIRARHRDSGRQHRYSDRLRHRIDNVPSAEIAVTMRVTVFKPMTRMLNDRA
jgi:hypothetical protein